MGAASLSSRAIIGMFYNRLSQDMGMSWMPGISMLFTSDQDSEEYPWLGQVPQMREWVGGRQAKGFIENGITVKNKHFEATIEFLLKDLRRDKTGQVQARINELADRTNSHWASLLSTLIANGAASACYDGQYFFDTDHVDVNADNQVAQSNAISVDISALPASVHGAVAAPSVEEMQQSILTGITQIMAFKDDRGEPMSEFARNFLVMVPPSLSIVASTAVVQPLGAGAAVQGAPSGLNIAVAANPRLSAWTDKFAVFRTDGAVKPFIRQQETEPQLKAKAEGSEFEFDNDSHQYGVDTWRNVAYGYWQHACLVTMA